MRVASERLGLSPTSTSRVRQLLDDPGQPLDGPESPGPGRNHVRLVWADTIPQQQERRRTAHEDRRPTRQDRSLDRLWQRVDELTDAIADGRSPSDPAKVAGLEEQVRQLEYDKQKALAAADALRDAWDKHAQADDLRRAADQLDQQAMTSLRRAEKARDDASLRVHRPDRSRTVIT